MARMTGNTVYHWRAYGDYSTSEDGYSVTINLTTGMQCMNWGYQIGYIYASANINGNDRTVDNVSFSSPTGGYVDKNFVSNSVRYSKAQYAQTKTITAYVKNHSGYHDGVSSVSVTINIPALASHTVSYNANGGSGAPGNQTKWYGSVLTLSSTRPTRTGYSFQGWATSASGSVAYQPGGSYSADANITLYAVWKADTYAIKFDANGGTGAPSEQTKTYGVDLTLSSTIPTLKNYDFLGWGTSAGSTTIAYNPGDKYTANSAATLYAIWKLAWIAPILTNVQIGRCDSAGVQTDEGRYVRADFSWSIDTNFPDNKIVSIKMDWKLASDSTYGTPVTIAASGTSGTVTKFIVGNDAIDGEKDYDFRLIVTDTNGDTTYRTVIAATNFIIDFRSGGNGVAFGKPSDADDFQVDMPAKFLQTVTLGDTLYTNGNIEAAKHIYLGNDVAIAGRLTSGNISSMLRMNSSDQVELNWTSGGLKGRVMKKIWEGNWTTGTITVPELPYYNVFYIQSDSPNLMGSQGLLAWRIDAYTGSHDTIHGCAITNEANKGAVHNFSFYSLVDTSLPTVMRIPDSNNSPYYDAWVNKSGWSVWLPVSKIYGLL